mmetsp:Transcript_34710/g.59660  ORF Transcript_34710/g.59660 Transcript_34710/m.59660 type:complete len:82 (-) Transcript_34710:359-604(-)
MCMLFRATWRFKSRTTMGTILGAPQNRYKVLTSSQTNKTGRATPPPLGANTTPPPSVVASLYRGLASCHLALEVADGHEAD